MSQITLGQDIGVVMISVALICGFVVVLNDSFSEFRRKQRVKEKYNVLFAAFDFLRNNGGISNGYRTEVGVVDRKSLQENIPQLIERFRREGRGVEVEIVSLQDNRFFKLEKLKKDPSQSVSFPIVYRRGNRKIPARIVVSTS